MTTKPSDFADLNALAIEACDLWQEHLSAFARDPNARAELTRFLEPQRRLLADWAAMMQQGAAPGAGQGAAPSAAAGASSSPQGGKNETKHAKTGQSGHAAATESTASTPSGGHAYGDDSLRVAQLALRVAELEKRLGQLEQQLIADIPGDKPSHGAARRTQRASS